MINHRVYHTAIQPFNQRIKALGLPELEELIPDGTIHRFGVKRVGWYRLEDDGHCLFGHFGNHKHNHDEGTDRHYFEYPYAEPATEAEKEAARKRREALVQQQQTREQEKRIDAEQVAQRLWDNATAADTHPYLANKGIVSVGIRVTTEPVPGLVGRKLVVPFFSLDKTLRTLQFIDERGKKAWLAGGAKQGHYYRIPGLSTTVYLAEGFATAASIHLATNQTVVMAGDTGNLALVAKTLRARLPKQRIVICADNDRWTDGNPGITVATTTARAINASVAIPEFKDTTGKPTDFNDLHRLEGLPEVKRQLEKSANDSRNPRHESEGDTPIIVRISEVKPKPIAWLWPERLALGKLSILAGDPGLGKSMVSLAIAAHVTRGKPWPVDQTPCPRGEVILLSAEDDIGDTIRPRLDAVNADVSKVRAFTMVKTKDPETGEPCERTVSLRKDLNLISRELKNHPKCALVIVDPLSAYLDGVDSHKNADVRALLVPLAQLAERHRVAMLAVTHLNKGGGQNAMYRTTGSLAFVAAARAAFMVTKDPEDPDRRLMLPIKNNLGDDRTGLAYHIALGDNGAPCVDWENEAVMITADEALSRSLSEEENTALDEAQQWLEVVLKEGPVDSAVIKQQASKAGLAWATVRRAKDKLNITARRKENETTWCWALPEDYQVAHQGAHLSNLKSEKEIQVAHPTPVPFDEQVEQLAQPIEKQREIYAHQLAHVSNLEGHSTCSYEQLAEHQKTNINQQLIQVAQLAHAGGRGMVEQLEPLAPSDFLFDGIEVCYIREEETAKRAVDTLLAADTLLGLDIETARKPDYADDTKTGLDPHRSDIRLVQLYAGASTVYVFDGFVPGVFELLSPVWMLPLVAHNAVFEIKHLLKAGIALTRIGCTMLQANSLTGQLPSLKHLAKQHLGISLDKSNQTSDWRGALTDDQIRYAAMDAVVVRRVAEKQRALLKLHGLLPVYSKMKDAQKAIAAMESAGCHFDREGHKILIRRWEEQRDSAEKALRKILGPDVSPTSGQQIGAWLEKHLDDTTLKRWPRTNTDRLKTDANTLKRYSDHSLVKPLLEHKDAVKRLSTYGEKYAQHINPVTGRIHASFRLGGTATGRLSCRDPNLQNPPRDSAFRALFRAPTGRCLVVADYGQIELRVAALLSKDKAMLDAYRNGEDLHRKTAAAVLGIDPTSVTKEQRQMAKAVNFGLLYGQGAQGLSMYAKASYGVDMMVEEAESARNAFFRAYPQLHRWQLRTANAAKRENRVKTLGGRVRDFRLEHSGYRFTEALNTPIQGAAAEVLLETLSILDKYLEGLDAKLVNIVHDELIVEVSEKDLERAKKAVNDAMLEGYLKLFPGAKDTLDGLVEVHSGHTWTDAKP